MKMIISQKTLMEALERGAFAALSDEAQSDTSIISLLIKAVQIKVDSNNLVIESATKLLASRYSIPSTKDNGIEIREEGSIFVPAKELYDWVKRQSDAKLALNLAKLDTPDIINPLVNDNDGTVTKGIKRIGTVKIVSRDESKTGNKWSLDCYASDQLGDAGLEQPKTSLFTIPSKQLDTGLKNISFAAMPKHYQHVYDSISFQNFQAVDKDNNPVGASRFFMLTCDTARSAVCELADVKNCSLSQNLLISSVFLSSITKLTDENADVHFAHEAKTNKVFIWQEVDGKVLLARISTTDQGLVKKFPGVNILVEKKYASLAKVSKDALLNRLYTSSLVNDSESYFLIKGDELIIYTTSVSGKSPSTSNISAKDVAKEYSFVVGSKMVMDFLRIVKDSEIEFFIPDGDRYSVKFHSKEDESFSFYIMANDDKREKFEKSGVKLA